jgi:putative peptidoglycan lipid II flippase
VPLMFFLNQFTISETLGTDPAGSLLTFGAVGLAIGASAGAWMELWRLMVTLRRRLDDFTLPWPSILKMHGIALLAIIPAAGAWYLLDGISWIILAAVVLALYGGAYLLIARLLKMEEINAWLGRFARMQRSEASEPTANPEP